MQKDKTNRLQDNGGKIIFKTDNFATIILL